MSTCARCWVEEDIFADWEPPIPSTTAKCLTPWQKDLLKKISKTRKLFFDVKDRQVGATTLLYSYAKFQTLPVNNNAVYYCFPNHASLRHWRLYSDSSKYPNLIVGANPSQDLIGKSVNIAIFDEWMFNPNCSIGPNGIKEVLPYLVDNGGIQILMTTKFPETAKGIRHDEI